MFIVVELVIHIDISCCNMLVLALIAWNLFMNRLINTHHLPRLNAQFPDMPG